MGLPIVNHYEKPLKDKNGIFGFRMEELLKIPKLEPHLPAFEAAVQRLHQVDVVHNDVSRGNVMLDRNGNITLIDLSYSGRVGDLVPDSHFFGREQQPAKVMDKSLDTTRLQTIMQGMSPFNI